MNQTKLLCVVALAFIIGLLTGAIFSDADACYVKIRYAYDNNGQRVWFVVNDDGFSEGVFEEQSFAEELQSRLSHPTKLVKVGIGYGKVVPNSRFVPRRDK